MLDVLEFWPDYGPGPLWLKGAPAPLSALNLPADLSDRLQLWNEAYEERLLPSEGDGDPDYLSTGKALLAEVRAALRGRFRVLVTEPWWGEVPSDPER